MTCKLTRQVTMQGLPSIRLVQENDKGLINKINSTLVNTVPLWRQQLAQAVTIYRSGQAADTLRAATDLTNDLLRANAENLKTANTQARREIERGVFDIEVVRQANQTLIADHRGGAQDRRRGQARPRPGEPGVGAAGRGPAPGPECRLGQVRGRPSGQGIAPGAPL